MYNGSYEERIATSAKEKKRHPRNLAKGSNCRYCKKWDLIHRAC